MDEDSITSGPVLEGPPYVIEAAPVEAHQPTPPVEAIPVPEGPPPADPPVIEEPVPAAAGVAFTSIALVEAEEAVATPTPAPHVATREPDKNGKRSRSKTTLKAAISQPPGILVVSRPAPQLPLREQEAHAKKTISTFKKPASSSTSPRTRYEDPVKAATTIFEGNTPSERYISIGASIGAAYKSMLAVSCGSLGLVDYLCKTAILNIYTDFCGPENIDFAHLGMMMDYLDLLFNDLMYCDIDALVESATAVLATKDKITPALLSKVFPLGKVRKQEASEISVFMQDRRPCSDFAVYFYDILSRCVEKRYIVIGNILLRFFEVLWVSLQSKLYSTYAFRVQKDFGVITSIAGADKDRFLTRMAFAQIYRSTAPLFVHVFSASENNEKLCIKDIICISQHKKSAEALKNADDAEEDDKKQAAPTSGCIVC